MTEDDARFAIQQSISVESMGHSHTFKVPWYHFKQTLLPVLQKGNWSLLRVLRVVKDLYSPLSYIFWESEAKSQGARIMFSPQSLHPQSSGGVSSSLPAHFPLQKKSHFILLTVYKGRSSWEKKFSLRCLSLSQNTRTQDQPMKLYTGSLDG